MPQNVLGHPKTSIADGTYTVAHLVVRDSKGGRICMFLAEDLDLSDGPDIFYEIPVDAVEGIEPVPSNYPAGTLEIKRIGEFRRIKYTPDEKPELTGE